MRKILSALLCVAALAFSLVGCGLKSSLNPNAPVTLTIWHVYGNQTESPFNDTIENFNATTGKEKGVYVSVTAIIDSESIDGALDDSANNAPGAAELPDLFTAYPRVAESIGTERLTDWNEIYSEEELSVFVDDFLTEGNIDDKQLTLPIAKSTEVLFVNKTLFDRFCEDTGYTEADFATFDSLFEMATAYYDRSGGKSLIQYDDFYNYFLINTAAKGGELVRSSKLNCTSKEFESVFIPVAKAAIHGGVSLYDNYATDLWKTGDVISYIGSSAGILYARDDVTYADNSTEDIEITVLPYPVFEGAQPTVMQRGVTLFAHNTENAQKNEAIKVFVDYLTEKEVNIDFVTKAGYIPGTTEAFEGLFADLDRVENPKYRMLYDAVSKMYGEYSFMPLPVFENSSAMQKSFDSFITDTLDDAHTEFEKRVAEGEDENTVMEELTARCLDEIKSEYR